MILLKVYFLNICDLKNSKLIYGGDDIGLQASCFSSTLYKQCKAPLDVSFGHLSLILLRPQWLLFSVVLLNDPSNEMVYRILVTR